MKSIRVKIKGISPLLMNRFTEDAEASSTRGTRTIKINNLTPREQADQAAYKDKEGKLIIPMTWIAGSFMDTASNYKQRGSRKSLRWVARGAFLPEGSESPEYSCLLVDGIPTTKYEVDSRPVVIPATKGRIMRHRPRIEEWSVEFKLMIDDEILDPKDCHEILNSAGKRSGIGAYRPNKMGPFGKYQVSLWEECN